MAKVIRRRWVTDISNGLARRDRRSCEYECYIPDALTGRDIALSSETAADIADAERAIAVLDAGASTLLDTEALARILLRAESVASSRIEGLEVGARRLLRAEAAMALGEEPSDVTATEVLANINAMASTIRSVSPGDPIAAGILLDFHRQLLAGTRLRCSLPDRFGPSRTGSAEAATTRAQLRSFRRHRTTWLISCDDLCAFCNTDSLPAVAQAAIAHAQFETIHPFVDGNGRTGRALIHLVLRRRGLATRVLPPVSLVLATWADDYVLGASGDPVPWPGRIGSRSEWPRPVARAVRRSVPACGG